jgi:hypothetical protein
MRIEVLHVVECPGHPVAVRLVSDALAAEGITTKIHEVLVADERTAREWRFHGSPSIRVNGRDVAEESPETEAFGLNCRWYFGSNRTGLPPIEMIQRAIAKARQGES